MICFLVILFNILCNTTSAAATASPNYYLRWITKEPVLPIYIEKKLDSPSTTDHKWFKYPQEVYLDEIENYESKYLYSQQSDKTVLYILDYSLDTHKELGTYEPRPIVEGEELDEPVVNTHKRDLYTLVYLKSHIIDKIDDVGNDRLHFFCNVSVLMPNIKKLNLNKANLQLIERSVNLKMGFFAPSKNTKSSADSPNSNDHQHKKSMRIIEPSRSRRDVGQETDGFIQINLDIGPMTILKSQLNLYANARERNLTCKLSLVELDTGNDLENFAFQSIVDSEVKLNNLLRLPPTNKPHSKATTTTSKARLEKGRKNSSSSPKSDLKFLYIFYIIFILVVKLGRQ